MTSTARPVGAARRRRPAAALRLARRRSTRMSVEEMTPAQERFYRASQWRMMWWKLTPPPGRGVVGRDPAGDVRRRSCSARCSRPTRSTPATPISSTPRRSGCISSTRGSSSRRSSTATTTSSTWTICAGSIRPNPDKPEPMRFFCRGDPYLFWGFIPGDFHLDLPGRGRAAVPARHRPARPRSAVAHHLRRAHLADRRADRRRGQLHARHHHRRHRRLLRRLDRHPDPARDRGDPVVSASAAVDGAVGDPAGDVEPDPRLFRHHDHPRHDRVDPSRARGALQAAVAARGGFLHRRGADGRDPGAHHRPPSAAELYEPPDRLGDAGDPQHDPRRDRAVVPRPRPAPADHELGRAARTRRRTSASSRSTRG